MKESYLEDDPLWYKDAVIYELPVRAFYDSNEDGIGDFKGLINKLDYLQNLGVNTVWLLPFYPSPLKDDGYDISDYYNVHSASGSLRDFKHFLSQAHERGIRVITELVLNHTSDQHAWFQKARRAKPGSPERDFYVWSDTPDRYRDARIIFKDFEASNWAWDPQARAYYWHRFYSHQPELNFDNPRVQDEMLRVIDFWFSMGVDGMRLDAVPYLFEREGTNCENLPETHAFLRKLRAHVDSKFKNRMLLAEANQWPEDAAAYFGAGDECNMAFNFPVMPRMFMAIQMEDSFPIVDILSVTPPIPEGCQWSIFLRNHDELTLEMVTDEERDYMYRVYARDPRMKINLGIRRRLAPLLGNNRRKVELMNIMLFSLPGTPVIYYGDEIGMGDNYYLGDRNGVRTPMQWGPSLNAGFSRANPQRLYLPAIIDPEYHFESINVDNQDKNLSSLLWWMKRVIAMRKSFKAFSRGSLEFITSSNPKILSFTRQHQDEIILVVINLSRFTQVVELDLAKYAGFTPQEVFSQNKFPAVKESPYVLTLSPHSHYWLLMQKEIAGVKEEKSISPISAGDNWENVLENKQKERLEQEFLPKYIKTCRWFGAKAKTIRKVKIIDNARADSARLLLLEVSYSEGSPELYFLPLSYIPRNQAQKILEEFPQSVIAPIRVGEEEGILYDSVYDENFRKTILSTIAHKRKIKGIEGEFYAYPGKKFKGFLDEKGLLISSQPLKVEQTNTSLNYENKFYLKLYRRLDEGINPELEIVRWLTEKAGFPNIPPFAGAIEYIRKGREAVTVGLLQGYIPNASDAWAYSLDEVSGYFERVLSRKDEIKLPGEPDLSRFMQDMVGGMYLEMLSLLGKRTAELHLALGTLSDEESFAPEPFSTLYQRSLYQSIQGLLRKTMQLLSKNIKGMPESIRGEAESVLAAEGKVLKLMQASILQKKISAVKIRIHGDYHLGQVLYTGKDFMIMDFEGEPARPLSERRLKHSPLKDVAGMIRSFHYAAHSSLFLRTSFRPEDIPFLETWIIPWYHYISGVFFDSYLRSVENAPFIPKEREDCQALLQVFLLEKAVYELFYELNNRPDWVIIPVKGINYILSGFSK